MRGSVLLTIGLFLCFSNPACGHSLGEGAGADITPPMRVHFKNLADLNGSFGPNAYAVRGVVERFNIWPSDKPLEICFISGSDDLRKLFANVGSRWLSGSSLKFDFGAGPGYRKCQRSNPSPIRVSFGAGGNWSFVGTDSQKYELQGASLNIDYAEVPPDGSEARKMLEATILHEVGHALGLQHEHQSPNANCDGEFNWSAIYKRYGKLSGWSKETIDFNFKTLVASERLLLTAYDQDSIMHYYFAPWMFNKGEASTCYVAHNNDLSEVDKSLMADLYPPALASAEADEERLQDRADDASEILSSLKFGKELLAKIGIALSERLSARKQKVALQFNLVGKRGQPSTTPTENCASFSRDRKGVVCKVSDDALAITVSP